jgi:predicted nucleic acid-binding protein
MKVLFDTNVVLDVLLNRSPWVTESAGVWRANDEGRLTGYLVASTLTDIFYVARRLTNLDTARRSVHICLDTFEICPVDRQTLEQAQTISGNDFEDNLQIACATIAKLDVIVTRDVNGFKSSIIPALTPQVLLTQLK